MTKRPSPFGDDSALQMKSHIRQKEVDRGVCKDQNMQLVFEKTKQMLFQGSKKLSITGKNDNPKSVSSVEELCPTPGQLCLDMMGHLCNNNLPQAMNLEQPAQRNNGFSFSKPCQVAQADIGTLTAGQLLIDSTGHLCSHLKSDHVSIPMSVTQQQVCNSCHHPSIHDLRTCNFCDKLTCRGCLRQCCSCQGNFCHLCSVLNYDDCFEKAFCLQCSG